MVKNYIKKIFLLIFLILFFCKTSFAKTYFCNAKEWKENMIIDIDFDLGIVQHPSFRNGEEFKARISKNEIFFKVDGEHWTIDMNSGNFLRKNFELEIYQKGKCLYD